AAQHAQAAHSLQLVETFLRQWQPRFRYGKKGEVLQEGEPTGVWGKLGPALETNPDEILHRAFGGRLPTQGEIVYFAEFLGLLTTAPTTEYQEAVEAAIT